MVFENAEKSRWDQQKIAVLENYYHVVIVLENWKFFVIGVQKNRFIKN